MKEYLVDLDGEQYLESAEDESEAIRLARTRHKAEHVRQQTCTLCGDIGSQIVKVYQVSSNPATGSETITTIYDKFGGPEDTIVIENSPTE